MTPLRRLSSWSVVLLAAVVTATMWVAPGASALVAGNTAPVVDAGQDTSVVLPATIPLSGTVTDDGQPNPPGATTVRWTQIGGPATAGIASPGQAVTSATVPLGGVYVFQLSAYDGDVTSTDTVQVSVTGPSTGSVIDVPVRASSDDAEETATGSVLLTSTDLDLINDVTSTSTTLQSAVGMRFTSLAIPKGSTVSHAWLQLGSRDAASTSAVLTVQAQAVDSAPTFTTTKSSITTRTRTSAAVQWTLAPWTATFQNGLDQRSPDLASVVQEVVSRSGWAQGNALALLVTGSGSRVAWSYDGLAALAPVLHVEFQPPQPVDNAPLLSVVSPVQASTVTQGDPITFAASARDPEDGDRSGAIQWASSIDGALGSGPQLTTSSLSLGQHQVTASVSDSAGHVTSVTRQVTVLAQAPVLLAAGDIATCIGTKDDATGALLDSMPGSVVTLGDNAYQYGSSDEFRYCYQPTWGRHVLRTHPSPGNHEYLTAGAAGYFGYFGSSAGNPGLGYYSYDVAGWHIISLDSEISTAAGSAQEQWLRADLAAHPAACTLAYFHRPLFTSGTGHGPNPAMRPLWQALYDYRADLVLNGHEHIYERFAPQDPSGTYDPTRGIREFTVGTGGDGHGGAGTPAANSQFIGTGGDGVLKLTLKPTGYDWQFVGVAGTPFTDSGSGDCVLDPSVNQAPVVNAGPDLGVVLPAGAALHGTVTDDGLPAGGALTSQWSVVSGPGAVSFADPGSPDTTATFGTVGTYVLRLSASDSALTSTDDVTVTVTDGNAAPVVNAGTDQTVMIPDSASLHATVSDDGLPSGSTLTSTWSLVSGPTAVTFADPGATDTTATFTTAGTYTLRITASDGSLSSSDDVTVTVVGPNTAPSVNAGPDATVALSGSASLQGTVTDDGLPMGSTLTHQWSVVSGPGVVTFSDDQALATSATFSANGTYLLRLTASDGALTSSDDVTITVSSEVNLAPSTNAGPDVVVSLGTSAALHGSVTDDGLPTGSTLTATWSVVSGPGPVVFANGASADTSASFQTAGAYVLRLTGSDGTLSSTDDVAVTVTPPDLVFKDGFESGNLSAWSSSVTGSQLAVLSAAALKDAYGMRVTVASNAAAYVADVTPNAESHYRARFWFDPNTIAMGKGDAHVVFRGLQTGGYGVVLVELRWSGTTYQLRTSALNDAKTLAHSAWYPVSDAPHSVEIDWRASTAAGANDGGVTLWVDGTARASLTGIDNDTRRVDTAQLGAVSGIDSSTRGSYFFDAFESRRSTYIGP